MKRPSIFAVIVVVFSAFLFAASFFTPRSAYCCGKKGHAATCKETKSEHSFTAEEIKAAMRAHIEKKQKQGNGVFRFTDRDDHNKKLRLLFVKIHDPVRRIEKKGYFACTDFRPADGPAGARYDLDFWLKPRHGKLMVTETRVHKDPVQVGGKWTKKARYTFVNDKPVVVK